MPDAARRVLIVDDAEEIGSSVAEVLRAEGYEVTCAHNGRQALDHMASFEELPGLILLDLMMPDMDGYQFRARQRSDPRLSHIPIVLMTAGGDIVAKAHDLGAEGYLKKPFTDVETILEAVGRFFP